MSSNGGSLRPTWSRGSPGFQPPPTVLAPSRNKFSALDDDEPAPPPPPPDSANSNSESGTALPSRPTTSFRSSRSSGGGGRSLSDLARSRTTGGIGSSGGAGRWKEIVVTSDEPVIRYTREKLLALRPRPGEDSIPTSLKHLEGVAILSHTPLDPVCWKNFDTDQVWATGRRTFIKSNSSVGNTVSTREMIDRDRRASTIGTTRGRWARGVALPPPRQQQQQQQQKADNPNDLWDDPLDANSAAADFSAFGAIPDDPKDNNGGEKDAFDFNKMAEATAKLETELKGSRKEPAKEENGDGGEAEAGVSAQKVNPKRPLATPNTTIRSGSGDDVNVFEDFEEQAKNKPALLKAMAEDSSASSRLMKMIGVNREETSLATEATETEKLPPSKEEEEPVGEVAAPSLNPWASKNEEQTPTGNAGLNNVSEGADIPINPWGGPVVAPSNQQSIGFDLAARLESERQRQKETEMLRRRQQEEAERRAAMEEQVRQQQQKQQQALQQRQQQQQQQQQQALQQRQQQQRNHSQVELVLMERISTILENSWGRSDMVSILSTLHSEDPRLIQLLGNLDSLRALIARHPDRVVVRLDPSFGAEMAVLLQTNAQYQQQKHLQAQKEELKLRQQLQQQQQEQQQRMHNRNGGVLSAVIPDAPWYYSDPQQNVQGPFRNEEMRQWLEAGYFNGDLPVSQQASGPFAPLAKYYPDLNQAFRNSAANDAAKRAAAQQEARKAKELEFQQRLAAEAEALARAEKEAKAKVAVEEAAAAEAARAEAAEAALTGQNEQSAQLKMLLGLDGMPPSKGETQPTQQRISLVKAKPANSVMVASAPPPVPPKPSPSAWGGSTTSSGPRKSMSEIQQEEARAAALLVADRPTGRNSSGGWANIAAAGGGGRGWQSGNIRVTEPAVVTGQTMYASTAGARGRSVHNSQIVARSAAQQPVSQPTSADDFGASMSPALEKWCKDQVFKLNGSDDLTLVSFCMTLNDPAMIRQYLVEYLGSTPQVNKFANEFINKRGLGKNEHEEWESTKPKNRRKRGAK